MTDKPPAPPPVDAATARRERLAVQLRDNLRKRRIQQKKRASAPAEPAGTPDRQR